MEDNSSSQDNNESGAGQFRGHGVLAVLPSTMQDRCISRQIRPCKAVVQPHYILHDQNGISLPSLYCSDCQIQDPSQRTTLQPNLTLPTCIILHLPLIQLLCIRAPRWVDIFPLPILPRFLGGCPLHTPSYRTRSICNGTWW